MSLKRLIRHCKEATLLTLKLEEKRLTFRQRLSLLVHLSFCVYCRRFKKQSKHLNAAFKDYSNNLSAKPPYQLSDDYKAKLERVLRDIL